MPRSSRWGPYVLAGAVLALLGAASHLGPQARIVTAQACPPRCDTPIVTPAWHMHMCDEPYADQLDDGHCMQGDGVTDFADGTDAVYILYCHHAEDLVVVQVKDSAGGLQYINHPDGMTYYGQGCETLLYSRRGGIRPNGSPYYTSAFWPEGPFVGIGRGIEWFVGLFVAFDAEAYYGTSAEAVLTARDPVAGSDPLVTESISVHVASTSDPVGIDIDLTEEFPDYPVFRSLQRLRFSTEASDPDTSSLLVSDHDEIVVSYCPRDCREPYTDVATWYELVATVTPTEPPTRDIPIPTPTATAPPELQVESLTLRPDPADVGYVPQQSANRNLLNHLGYPTIYVGMWTHGANAHLGMVQFDLSSVPEGVYAIEARLDLVGRDRRFVEPGAWTVKLLESAIDAPWRDATYEMVSSARVLAQIGAALDETDLVEGETNVVGFAGDQLPLVDDRLGSTRRISFRIDGPAGGDNDVFGWNSGVDTYGREPQPPDPELRPALYLRFARGARPTPATADPTATDGSVGPTESATSAPPTGSATAFATGVVSPTGTITATLTGTPGTTATSGTGSPTVTPDATAPAGNDRQVCLVAFDDRDGDGLRGASERFLAGVTVRLTHVDAGAFVSWTTDGQNDPDYCWQGLATGAYVLEVVQAPPGYASSGDAERRFSVPLDMGQGRYEFGLRNVPTPTAGATAAPSPPASETRPPTETAVTSTETPVASTETPVAPGETPVAPTETPTAPPSPSASTTTRTATSPATPSPADRHRIRLPWVLR